MGQDQHSMTAQTSEKSADAPPASALHRKARVGAAEHQTRSMSVQKALRLTLAKVADEMFDMALTAIGLRSEQRDGDALADLFDAPALLMALDGPSGRRAAAVFDPVLVGGLIQQQTMGRVMPETDGGARSLTATDAAICAPFLDALLERAALLPETDADRQLLQGYRFGTRAEDARILQMTLEAPEYQVVHITVDIAAGTRQGQIILCIPMMANVCAETDPIADPEVAGIGRRQHRSLNETVMALHIDLNVALARLSMPLSAVSALAPGDVLELGVTSFDQSRVLTMAGHGVGRGTLGQIDGVRALRVDHQKITVTTPKRRASDRAELDLPEVSGDGTGTRIGDSEVTVTLVEPSVELTDLPPQEPSTSPDLAATPDLPDMSDLPGFADDNEFSEVPHSEAG